MRFPPIQLILYISLCTTVFAPPAVADVPLILAGETFACTPTHVWDGDGPIWCEEGPRLRLAGIASSVMSKVGHLHLLLTPQMTSYPAQS